MKPLAHARDGGIYDECPPPVRNVIIKLAKRYFAEICKNTVRVWNDENVIFHIRPYTYLEHDFLVDLRTVLKPERVQMRVYSDGYIRVELLGVAFS